MKDIIEKLGIRKKYTGYVNSDIIKKLQDQRDEMLEALIDITQEMELEHEEYIVTKQAINIIEKATGEYWHKIKEILK